MCGTPGLQGRRESQESNIDREEKNLVMFSDEFKNRRTDTSLIVMDLDRH